MASADTSGDVLRREPTIRQGNEEEELRARLARTIIAARRTNQRQDGNQEDRRASPQLADNSVAKEDAKRAKAADQAFFQEDVGRVRRFLKNMQIHTQHQSFYMNEATHVAPPATGDRQSTTTEAQVNSRSIPFIHITVRFTTTRPVPSHTARGTRRRPTLVFCLPPAARDPDTYVESLPRPTLERFEEKSCNICREPFTTDGPAIGAGTGGSGDTWMHHSRPEILVQLPCKHIFGSQCLVHWCTPSANKDCPLCRTSIIELKAGYRPPQLRVDVQEASFRIARIMAEQGQISGFEFTYGYTGVLHPEELRLKIPRERKP